MPSPPALILASTSVYRRELLERLRLPFSVSAPKIDEAAREGEAPRPRAERLALEKAQAIAQAHPAQFVIGADQVAACEGTILDKPGNLEAARAQLRTQSGRAVQFYSAVALVHSQRRIAERFVDLTTVVFRDLSEAEIEAYLLADRPYDCAGSLRSESLGISLCERIETSDPTGLIGLPLIRLAASLRSCGYALP
ncbi:MAG TPA: nucleoside triphosphate pyrophosphatase [Steroidobacteraceae bacterium]|nr:nucleoside triphosphate pyrophosphatase [Steroidobacteraceae bacterium]